MIKVVWVGDWFHIHLKFNAQIHLISMLRSTKAVTKPYVVFFLPFLHDCLVLQHELIE